MPAREFTVRIEPHGATITVREGRPVLEAALAAGLNLPRSCQSGHCASCIARLRSGQIQYPNGLPAGLTAQEARDGSILLCQARATSDLVVDARLIADAAAAEIKTLPCRVARANLLAPDVMQLHLRLPVVESLDFEAGQYLDVLLDGGRRRSFSIASPPHERELELHVRRVSGGLFTDKLFRDATNAAGSLLRIEGPFGRFRYTAGTRPLLMIAGGTGFAPLKAMLQHLFHQGTARAVHLYWGARAPHDVYEDALVQSWVRQHPWLRFNVVLSESTGPQPPAHHRPGWVHQAVLDDHSDLAAFDVYTAGPPALVTAVRTTLPARGAREEQMHFDAFDYNSDPKPLA